MRVGVPKGLMYWKYGIIIETFLKELNVDFITSPDTCREILDRGTTVTVDDACLPVKVFHGHVDWLKDKCDLIIVPRIMQIKQREYICPKFCGIVEMIKNSIADLPLITEEPVYALSQADTFKWFSGLGKMLGAKKNMIKKAFDESMKKYSTCECGYNDNNFDNKIALLGHPYNIYDKYCNMNIRKKLNDLGVGVITEEYVDENIIDEEIKNLYKKPFWTFARKSYGAAMHLHKNKLVDGVIYVSSFACGIDSVVIELIKEEIGDLPFMVLKIDEHTGEAGVNTRLEAFSDMLLRRNYSGNKLSEFREHGNSSQSAI